MAEESTDTTAESSLCSEEMRPISSFINNRRKMLEVAFSAVDSDKLTEIVPPCLKDTKLDELKLVCYEELCCLTDEALKSILEDNKWDESSSTEDKKNVSSMEICSHEPRTFCGFEACKLEDTTSSTDSSDKDILEIGISEEEVSHLLEEIPDISKDTNESSPSSSVVPTSNKKCDMLDDVSTIHKDSLHTAKEGPAALDENSLELWELENRAHSIRSLIMECDSTRENVSEISDKLTGIDSSEYRRRKYNILDGMTVAKEHQEVDPLFLVCTPGSKVAPTSCKTSGTNLNCKNNLTLYEKVGHSAVLVSDDFTVMETKIAENSPRRVAHENVNSGDNETVGSDSYNTNTQGSPYNDNSTGVESAFHNTDQLQITISALSGDSLFKKDMHMNAYAAEEMKEKNIHKVVETSKMCTKLRERIKRTQQLKKFKEDIKAKTIILGTVEEYESLNMK